MKVIELQGILGTLLGPVLGSYSLGNNNLGLPIILPAIYVVNDPLKEPPKGWKVSGLEAIIRKTPEAIAITNHYGVIDRREWVISLIQHNLSGDLQLARELIFRKFTRAKVQSHLELTEENLEQLVLRVPDEQYFYPL